MSGHSQEITRYGPWAIVTGASQGIGEGFARELARRGFHIVLVSRREAPLAALGEALTARFGVQTRVVTADMSEPGAGRRVVDATADLDVGLLVSNAGAARMGGFLQNELAHLSADLHLNAASHLELTHVFASRLRARGRPGGVLLVASTAALSPMALGANYSGAKAFMTNLGESLNRELAELDIDVTVLLPGPTHTKGLHERSDIAMGKLPMPAMSVNALVLEGLQALKRRKARHVAGAMNRWSARLMPRRLMAWVLSRVLRRNTASHLLPSAPIAEQASVTPIRSVA